VQDKPRAGRELARVLRPAGRLLLRSGFSDHMPRIWWLEHFPRGFEVDASPFQPPHEVSATFTSAGWRDDMLERGSCRSRQCRPCRCDGTDHRSHKGKAA
jgi:hypothetical protein